MFPGASFNLSAGIIAAGRKTIGSWLFVCKSLSSKVRHVGGALDGVVIMGRSRDVPKVAIVVSQVKVQLA